MESIPEMISPVQAVLLIIAAAIIVINRKLIFRRHAGIFKKLLAQLAVSNDDFIQTSSDQRHIQGARKLWNACKKDIYKKTYTGLYCVGCEEFKTDKDLVGGKCPEHPSLTPEVVEEENYFFKLGAYQDKLKTLITQKKLHIIPESRANEMLSFIESGLQDLSISRSTTRARGWGIGVPDDPSQVMYVWMDALSNYTNALGYADDSDTFKKFWSNAHEIIHVIGKGIVRFHAIYWPALLMSAGERSPTQLYSHGYLTVGGQKMSKSLGNVIDPFVLLDQYGTDAFRYFFTREVSTLDDSDVTLERFHDAYNGSLANGLGNFVARVMKMATTHLLSPVTLTKEDEQFETVVSELIEHYEFNRAMDVIFEHVQKGDQYIQETQPFKAIKDDATKEKALADIEKLVHHIYKIAVHLTPFMPATAEAIKTAVKTHTMPPALFPRKE
jgi:methionyl-tRNA synthetase